MNPVLNNIFTRRSIRNYNNQEVLEVDLKSILTAGSYAPNALGLQNWRFTCIKSKEVLNKVNETIRQTILSIPVTDQTNPRVKSMIKRAEDPNAHFLYHAPVFVIVTHDIDNPNAMSDAALALGNMMLAAHSLGIGSCWLNQLPGLTHLPQIRQLLDELGIPQNHIIYGSAVFGYPAGEAKQAAPRKDVFQII